MRALTQSEFQAGWTLAAGLLGVTTIGLFAAGKRHEAIVITLSTAVIGAFISAARKLEEGSRP